MKITTKTGDKGTTSLFGGRRVSKASPYVELVGELDELQSFLGWCKVGKEENDEYFHPIFEHIQDDVYRMMAFVGFEMKWPKNIEPISEKDVIFLERFIEEKQKSVSTLNEFIRPGSNEAAARCHITRSICRRIERRMVDFNDKNNIQIPIEVLKYLNRLSDLLFLLGYDMESKIIKY